jgi:hypothetical protein
MTILSVVLLCAVPIVSVAQLVSVAQPSDVLDLKSKLRFHSESVYSPLSIAGRCIRGDAPGIGTPEEWGQGGGSYGKRFASTVAYSGMHEVLAFGLIRRCTRTRDIFDRATRDSRGERPRT